MERLSTEATEKIHYWQDIYQREAGMTAGQVAVSGLYDLFEKHDLNLIFVFSLI